MLASDLQKFIFDYLFRLIVILEPAKKGATAGGHLIEQLGIESRVGREYNGRSYRPARREGKSFWSKEVTATTHHQLNLCYWENIILYLLALNFLEINHLEAQLRCTLLRSTRHGFWRATNGTGHELVQNPQRIALSQSFS